ncbi:DUF1249 family protein [Colwellia sp. KU-HH00111]|uniref:DUF1249 domain-containing protein n=1 Tax=Colwellia sp. KU-HH00111 TaxID=3127652 RepID=UPI00310A14A3
MSFFPNSKVNSRQRYQPNLVSLMTLCANNYNLLLKLQANKTQRHQQRDFFINDRLAYVIVVKEVTPYTSLLTFEQKTPTQQLSKHSYHPRMSIRLYHDARMAEVISSQGIQQVKPRYDYPNKHMHQQDEKQQINQFLNEWLQLCLAHGQVKVELKNCQ